jgi:hypothetical protein
MIAFSDKWPGFHDDAKKSKVNHFPPLSHSPKLELTLLFTSSQGVGKQAKNDGTYATLAKSEPAAKPALRPELQQAVDDCMEDYEYLKQFARKP